MIHGFAEYSENFFEIAYQFALNGFDVHMFDLEGFGSSSGLKAHGPFVEDFHY